MNDNRKLRRSHVLSQETDNFHEHHTSWQISHRRTLHVNRKFCCVLSSIHGVWISMMCKTSSRRFF